MNSGRMVRTVSVALVGLSLFVCFSDPWSFAADADGAMRDSGIDALEKMGPLVDATLLAKVLASDNLAILDLGPKRETYNQGHLPGAHYVHWITDITDRNNRERYNLLDRQGMQALLSRLGIRPETSIVIYDADWNRLSTRMYWSLKSYGHQRVHVLNGGRLAWIRKGFQLTKRIPRPKRTNYLIELQKGQTLPPITAKMPYISQHLEDPNVIFLDGRPESQYTGEKPGKVYHTGVPHKNRGHIPGAKHLFWKDSFNDDGTFKKISTLTKLYAKQGVVPEKTVVTYCNEGLHAAPQWFVLKELLGCQDVRLYDDSMAEWANSSQPLETGGLGSE